MPSRQSASVRCSSSSAILACAYTSSTDLSAAISTPRSGAHCLQSPLLLVPALLAAHPGAAARALHELGADLLGGLDEGLVTGLLPGGRLHPLGGVGSLRSGAARPAPGA